ncbi:MAG: hypothetical protein V4596_01090, partial [Bdellovibrionota bacterium]
MFNLHQRMYFLAKLFLFHFIFFAILRVIFYLSFKGTATAFTEEDLLRAFYLGAKFDIRLAFIMIIPVWFFGYFPYMNPLRQG